MKKMSLIVLVAIMAFAANAFAQDATKPVGQERTKTTELKKGDMKKRDAKVVKKHHKKREKSEKKQEAAPEKK